MTIVETPLVVTAPPVDESMLLVQPPTAAPVPKEPIAPSEAPRSPRHKRQRPHRVAVLGVILVVVTCGVAALLSVTASTAGPAGPVAPPAHLQVTGATSHAISFRWEAPLTGAELLAYEVVRDGVVADVLMPVQSTYTASGLAAGRSFTFQIRAVYARALSAPSTAVAATSR